MPVPGLRDKEYHQRLKSLMPWKIQEFLKKNLRRTEKQPLLRHLPKVSDFTDTSCACWFHSSNFKTSHHKVVLIFAASKPATVNFAHMDYKPWQKPGEVLLDCRQNPILCKSIFWGNGFIELSSKYTFCALRNWFDWREADVTLWSQLSIFDQ